jgi:hypothetical protein
MATLMHNIKLYGSKGITAEGKERLEKEMEAAIPLLSKLGMFELFCVEEWESGGTTEGAAREGKMFVGRRAREMELGKKEN